MPKYFEIVRYVKENHVDWNTDVFDILKGYFSEYSPQVLPSPSDDVILVPDDVHTEFREPDNKEYSIQDVLDLFGS